MSIVEFSKELDSVVEKYDLSDVANPLKQEFGVIKSIDLQKAIESLKEEDRLLRVGIVGRVKAGKSSLLNALIFDGVEVLPKAATPMTASLVMMEYSKNIEANVEFFTSDDIEEIKREHSEYLKQLKNLTEQNLEELKSKNKKNKPIEELKERAIRQAKRELKNSIQLSSSYEQYERMKNSGISLTNLKQLTTITASTKEELNKKLLDFVGAEGIYMPFTKSVTLRLDEDSLKNLQIIDTPGVNDPVTSREERTRELLKECDVVFIVSPSGQFLSSEDMDLFDRIRTKEGISEIYILASQIDNQLYGSEKEKGGGILPRVLENISLNLTNHMKAVFSKDEDINSSKIYKNLLKNDVLYTSGVSYSIAKKLSNKESFDDNEKHVWELLKANYKDFFSDDATALYNLNLLANIDRLKEILDEVKLEKEKIIKSKINNFIQSKKDGLIRYKSTLINEIKEYISKIQNTTIEDIETKKRQLKSIIGKSEWAVDNEYEELIDDLQSEMNHLLIEELNRIFRKVRGDISDAEGYETKTYEVSISKWYNPLSWGQTETRYKTYTIVRAGFVRNSLEDLTDDVKSVIRLKAVDVLKSWKRELPKRVVKVLRQSAGDENLDIDMILKAIKKVTNSIKYPEIEYDTSLPSSLRKSGTLKKYEAERFVDEARDYVRDLQNKIESNILEYIEALMDSLKKMEIAKEIFKKYEQDIQELENSLKNQKLVIEKNERIVKALEEIKF